MTELKLKEILAFCQKQVITEAQEAEVLARYIFANPEASGAEYKSSAKIIDYLAQRGFKIQSDLYSLPTAFKASIEGFGGPKIAFIAEYDALPGFGEDGNEYAHACGHHWITGSSVTAVCALTKTLKKFNLPGEVVLLGCPDEELGGGKIAMLKAGAFDQVDLCLEAHLGSGTEARYRGKVREGISIRFSGKQTHGSGSLTRGANALHALVTFLHNLESRRDEFSSGVEFSWIINDGGHQANVVPGRVETKLMVRAENVFDLEQAIIKIKTIAEESVSKDILFEILSDGIRYLPLRCLPTLTNLAEAALVDAGFHDLVKHNLPTIGSTDLGNVSQVIPTQYFIAAMGAPRDVYLHEAAALDYVLTENAFLTMQSIASAMCQTAIQLIFNPTLLEAIWNEHKVFGMEIIDS